MTTTKTTKSRYFLAVGVLAAFVTIGLSTLTFLSLTSHKQTAYPLVHDQRRNLATTSYADTFPDRNLVLDLMQLSDDILDVNGKGVSASDAISNPKFEEVYWFEAELSTEVMIVRSRGDGDLPPIVIFRGSEEIDDWKVNTNIVMEKSRFENAPESVKIHRGFQNALFDQNIVGMVEDKVLELVGESGEVLLTGHSLGGANAHITAAYLTDKYPNMKATMINFGAPRLGNDDFKSWTEGSLTNLSAWRYVYRADVVPRLIPTQLGYVHAGHLFAIYRRSSECYYLQIGGGEYEEAPLNWYYATSFRHHWTPTYTKFFNNNINNDSFWPTTFEKKSSWWSL